jgi:hypothetical protein
MDLGDTLRSAQLPFPFPSMGGPGVFAQTLSPLDAGIVS